MWLAIRIFRLESSIEEYLCLKEGKDVPHKDRTVVMEGPGIGPLSHAWQIYTET